jgi:DinB superfamily
MAADSERHSVEPWLRGPLADVHPLLAPTLHAFAQAREDVAHWTNGLSDAEIWSSPEGIAPVGFHLRHIAGSVDRLTAYIRGEQLTVTQLEAIRHEMEPGPSSTRPELLEQVNDALHKSEQTIRTLDPATLTERRTVGRKHLPTTVIGLVVHLAEHTQRHVGELIVTTKLCRKQKAGSTRPDAS